MVTAAIIGPDGAGKTTVCRRLEEALPLRVRYIYMGVNFSSSNVMLPTSRAILEFRRALGRDRQKARPSHRAAANPHRKGLVRRAMASLRSGMRLANLLAEECFRHTLAWHYRRSGKIVLFDRWFFADCYASDVAGNGKRRLSSRIHGYMLEHLFPKPDLVIFLDAPAEVLFARKGEGTIESLERMRREYRQLAEVVKHFVVVDASQPEERVLRDVNALIGDFYRASINCRAGMIRFINEEGEDNKDEDNGHRPDLPGGDRKNA